MATMIFDLDGTVIDSSHRYKAGEDGTVDLTHWRAHCTRSHIMRDTLLPLADLWKKSIVEGHTIVVSTARVMISADYEFLRINGLFAHIILARDGEKDARPGTIQKEEQLRAIGIDFSTAVMFEDCDQIRAHLTEKLGLLCLHPADVV